MVYYNRSAESAFNMSSVITLTTDFGLNDAYVAAMKGVILGINPEVKLIDICHTIQPQNILQAAFVLSTVYEYFPEGTVHLVVVDPGVGTERKALILKTPQAYFIAPDNGVLSYVIEDYSNEYTGNKSEQDESVSGLEVVAITRSEFWHSPVSSTFHGRDIFAPVAARLSLGLPAGDFGEEISSLMILPHPHPYQKQDGSLVGHIIHIDNFGNLITDVKSSDLPDVNVNIEIGNRFIAGLSNNYSEGNTLLALIGSSGYLEISVYGDSAGILLNAHIGDEITVKK